MNFLSPWFLLGALAIAGPILFHLIRRAAREKVSFSSVMFLRPTPPKVTKRRRLEHIFLLILRCLALLLLATGFARPFFFRNTDVPNATGEARQRILLIDASASMRRGDAWQNARKLAADYLEQATPADRIAVVTFDRQPHTLVGFADWTSWPLDQRSSLADQRLATVSPGWKSTHLGLALTSAAELFEDHSPDDPASAHREIILISDLQEGAKLDGLQGHEWPFGVRVTIEPVASRKRSNAGIEVVAPSGIRASDTNVLARVTNARDSGTERFRLAWTGPGAGGNPVEVYLPPGQSRTFPVPAPTPVSSALQLTGDDEEFDNRSWFVVPETEQVLIAYLADDPGTDPARLNFYLQRVFVDSPRRQVRFVSPGTNSIPNVLNRAALAVIPDQIRPADASAVREWISNGHTALFVMTDARSGPTLAALAGVPEISVSESSGKFALFGEIDFTHPLFAAFADPRFSDFTQIHFWKHRRWEIPSQLSARVIARFDDRSPALTQINIGKGHLLVLAAGWNPSDSQLALSSKFPPLMQILLEWSGAGTITRQQFLTGDAIPSITQSEVEWQKPDGTRASIAPGAAFTETEIPGIYIARTAGQERRFAVNLPIEESRTAPMPPDELARLGVPLENRTELTAAQVEVRERRLKQTELENRQKLWRWLIAGVLAVTFGEVLLSGWLARRVRTAEAAA